MGEKVQKSALPFLFQFARVRVAHQSHVPYRSLLYVLSYLYRNNRDVVYQQKQRAAKLAQALVSLDDYLRSRTFMVGQRLTLADTHLSIEILPLFDIKLNGQPLIKAICSGTEKIINENLYASKMFLKLKLIYQILHTKRNY